MDGAQSPGPKAKAKAKAKGLAQGGSDGTWMLSEKIVTLNESMQRDAAVAEHIYETVEIADMLGVKSLTPGEDQDACYSLNGPPPERKKKGWKSKKEKNQKPFSLSESGGIGEVWERIQLVNPEFVQIREMKELDASGFLNRKYQRPTGYSAITRVHCGRLCLPCLLYTSPSPRDQRGSRMPSSA